MNKFTRLTPLQREELVAYLDGELEPSQLEEVETSISRNQVARHDLNQLSKAYDLLDYLPKVSLDPDLTRKTLGRLEIRDTEGWKFPGIDISRMRRYLMGVTWFVLLSATAIGAYQLSQFVRPDPVRLLLEDLPVIENLDRYSAIDADPEFLKKLQQEGIFEESAEGGK